MKNIFLITVLLLLNISDLFAQKIHPPAEIFEMLEKSTLNYELNTLDEEILAKDQTFNLNSADFYRKSDNSSLKTIKIELSSEAFKIKEEAEKYFEQKDYTKAREFYEKVLKIHPEYSKILTYIGQTYLSEGQEKKAVEYFKKAIENNYIDYMAHWFLGKYYLKKNQLVKALDEIVIAHILNRNHKLILDDLVKVLQKSGYTYENWTFTPQIKISSNDQKLVKVDYKKEWLGYALVKALWKYEPNYKESMGVASNELSMLEEREALFNLYAGNVDNKILKQTPFITLVNSLDHKQLDEFILYEIFIVENPFIAYQFPEEIISNIKNYIIKSRCSSKVKKKKKK